MGLRDEHGLESGSTAIRRRLHDRCSRPLLHHLISLQARMLTSEGLFFPLGTTVEAPRESALRRPPY